MGSTPCTWVFDLDGTLIDSMTALQRLAGDVLATHYGVTITEAEEGYRRTSGEPFVRQVERLYPGDERNAAAVAAFETRKRTFYLESPAFPEVGAVLQQLRSRGDFIAVSSNSAHDLVADIIARHALPVDQACGWQDGVGKGPAHFQAIARTSGAAPGQLHFVGDSLHDAATAQAHGLAFTGRAGTFAPEEFQARFPGVRIVHSLTELLA